MSGQTCMCEPVQRFSPDGPELTGQSLNVEAQCVPAGGDGPLETEWITEDLIARTQEVWGDYLEREVDREEAIEMLLNVQRIALAFFLASMEGESE